MISGKDLEGWITAPDPLAAMEKAQNQAYYRDRRERIATAALAGMLANPSQPHCGVYCPPCDMGRCLRRRADRGTRQGGAAVSDRQRCGLRLSGTSRTPTKPDTVTLGDG
jgi:hypothetical protein